jgi:LysR family transcriptional regulator, glycine cleavage system transcriptional activator
LILTEAGQTLYRVTTDALDRLQNAIDQLGSVSRTRQLSVTTTTGFASLWLIPRLPRFTNLYPGIDVRISATTDMLNLERSLVDLAIRYCPPETVPEGRSVPLVRKYFRCAVQLCSATVPGRHSSDHNS